MTPTPSAMHRLAEVADDVLIGPGSSIGPYCVVGLDGDGTRTICGNAAILRSHVVIYRGTKIGHRFHAGHHVLIREETSAGDSVSVGSGSIVEHHVRIEDSVRLHSNCFVPEFSVIEAEAWLGPGVILTNARHPHRPSTKAQLEPVVIRESAVLGAGVIVLPGRTIGQGALVGAGSLVTTDVPDGATFVGHPARSI